MRPSVLYPGDCLLYKDRGDLLGRLIEWGSWTDGYGAPQYVHVALVANASQLACQNPGGPHFEDLNTQPWDCIDVFRPNLRRMDPGVLPIWPGADVPFAGFLHGALKAHWGEGYGYAEIGGLEFEDLLARLGAMADVEARRRQANAMLLAHQSICSVFAGQEVLRDALAAAYQLPGVNLWPDIGPGQLRPADWPTSQYMERVG